MRVRARTVRSMLTTSPELTKRGGGRLEWLGVDDDLDFFDLRDDTVATPVLDTATRPAAPVTGRPAHRPAHRSTRATRPARRVAAASGGQERTALLIDLENYCPGSRHPRRVLSQLQRLLDATGPVETTVAVAARNVVARQRRVLTEAGIPVRSVAAGRNAADEALIDEARRLHAGGTRRFYVASGDHIFARVADYGDLVVLTHAHHEVSNRLAAAATEVRIAA